MTAVTKAMARLRRDDSGQVLMFVMILMLALLLFMLTIPNVTHVTTSKMRAQTSADIGAYTGAIWLARALNLIAVLNTGIRWMYVWMVVLTAVLAIAAALQVAEAFFPAVHLILVGVCAIFFGAGGFDGAVAKYKDSIPALRKSANYLAELRNDVAVSFPGLATVLGTYLASKNMGCNDGIPSLSRGGFSFTRPKIKEIELEPDGSGLLQFLEQITEPLGGGFGIDGTGEVGGGVTVGDDFGVESRYKITYHNSATVHQRLRREDRYAYVWQRYRRVDPPSTKTPKSRRLDMTVQFDADLCGKYLEPHDPGDYLWPNGRDGYYCVDADSDQVADVQPVERDYDGMKFPLWKDLPGDDARHAIIDKYVTERDTMRPETDKWTKLDYLVDAAWITFDDADSWGKPQKTPDPEPGEKPALPAKVKPGFEPYVLSFTWRLNPTGPMGLAPVIAGKLFRGHNVQSLLPLIAVAKACPYLDANSTLEDTLYNPSWDATLAAIFEDDVTSIRDEDPGVNGGKPQESYDFVTLFESFILTH